MMSPEQKTILISWLEKKAGYNILSPAGATNLCLDVQTATGTLIGVNTMKRLLGIIPSDHAPRTSTLDIVAIYLGAKSWSELSEMLYQGVSAFDTPPTFIDLSTQPVGKELTLVWPPDRRIRLRHSGEGKYQILESENSKLLANDLLTLTQVCVGFPFLVKEVCRSGQSIGTYTAALQTGLTSIIF